MYGHSKTDLIVPESDLECRVIRGSLERVLDRDWPVGEGVGEALETCRIAIQSDGPDEEGWFSVLAGLKTSPGEWSAEFGPLRGRVGLHFDGRTVVFLFPAAAGAVVVNEIDHGRPLLDRRQFPADPAP